MCAFKFTSTFSICKDIKEVPYKFEKLEVFSDQPEIYHHKEIDASDEFCAIAHSNFYEYCPFCQQIFTQFYTSSNAEYFRRMEC